MKLIKKGEIIGYRVPFSLSHGRIKKNSVVYKTYFGYQINYHYHIPNEIIEQWEPEYAATDTYIYPLRMRIVGEEKEIYYTYITKEHIKTICGKLLSLDLLQEIAFTSFPEKRFKCEEVVVNSPDLFGTAGNQIYLNVYDVKEMLQYMK